MRTVAAVLLIALVVLPAAAMIVNFSWKGMTCVLLGWILIAAGLLLRVLRDKVR